jgi:hypothetical protein
MLLDPATKPRRLHPFHLTRSGIHGYYFWTSNENILVGEQAPKNFGQRSDWQRGVNLREICPGAHTHSQGACQGLQLRWHDYGVTAPVHFPL